MKRLGNNCEVVLYPNQFHSFFHRGSPQNFADTLTRAEAFLIEHDFLSPK